MPVLYNGIQIKTIKMPKAKYQDRVGFLVLYFCIIYRDVERQENAPQALISPSNKKSKIEKILENAAILEM